MNKSNKKNSVRTSKSVATTASTQLKNGSKKEKKLAGCALVNRKKK